MARSIVLAVAALGLLFLFQGRIIGSSRGTTGFSMVVGNSRPGDAAHMYIDLLKRAVLNFLYQCHPPELNCVSTLKNPGKGHVDALSMIGWNGLTMVEDVIHEIVTNNIPGDVMEAGVFKGGTSIFMAGVLRVLGDRTRRVYVADSFAGIPPVSDEYKADAIHKGTENLLPLYGKDQVYDNFYQFNLADARVVFLEGWFRDTLAAAGVEQLSLLRIDGDLFESTWDVLTYMYPKLVVGGFVVVDDYGDWEGCRKAVDLFRDICVESSAMVRFDGVAAEERPDQRGKFAQWQKVEPCNLSRNEFDAVRRQRGF